MRIRERQVDTLKQLPERLAYMDAAQLAEADTRLRATVATLPGMTAEDLESLRQSLEDLRRALTFAREIYGKRLEALSNPGAAYTTAGCEHHVSEPLIRLTA